MLPVAEFAYNNAPHAATQVSPFFANYGYNPRATISLDVAVPDPLAHNFAKSLSLLHEYVREQISVAQQQTSRSVDQHRLPAPDYAVGDKVWLSTKNIKTARPTKKLDRRRAGPFVIEKKISSHAYRLKLPRALRFIHPVFHVNLLSPHHANTIPNRVQDPPPPEELEGEVEYTVAAILDSRVRRKKLEYLVQWQGYENTGEATSWEPAENVSNAQEEVALFHETYPDKPGP
jgi:hypothetical protein